MPNLEYIEMFFNPRLIEQLKASPLHRLADTLRSWLQPVLAMWRFSKTNGITEGFHTKMEMITRRALGFRNFENYRLLKHLGLDEASQARNRSPPEGLFPHSTQLS